MPIRDSLARWLTKASVVGLEASEMPDRGLEKGFDDAALLSTYADDAWPYIVGNKVAEQAAQAPIEIGRETVTKGRREFVPVGPDHPVQALFDSPNPQMDGGEFIQTLILYMGFTGHAPIEVVKGAPGAIIGAPGRRGTRTRAGFELWLHHPDPWQIVPRSDGTIQGYLYKANTPQEHAWDAEHMTYLRWPNPNSRWYGQGHIQAVRQQVMAEEYAAIRDKKFEKQLGVPPGILSSEMPLGDTQAKELQKRWEQAVGGYRNAGKIAVLGSKTSYQPVALNSHDAQWLDTRADRVEIIVAAWGASLPLFKMGDSTFSNVAEARAELWEGSLAPKLGRIGRMLTSRLLPLLTSEPLIARFDLTKIEALSENDLEAAQTAKAWSDTGSVTIDEIRLRLGLDPHEDKAFGKRVIVPSTVQLQDPAEVAEAAKLGAEAQRVTIDTTKNPPRGPGGQAAPRKAESIDRDVLLDPIRDAYKRDLSSFFQAQASALTPLAKALPQDEAEDLIERAIGIITAKRWRERLARISEPALRQSITLGAAGAAETLGVGVSFSIPASEAALRLLTNHLNVLGIGIQNTTVEDVRRVLTEALKSGASNAEIRQALGGLFDGYQDWRLDRISRTETTAAYNLGGIGQYRDAGVTMVHVVDGDIDENCASWNGRTVTLDEAEGSPLGHPNCRRTWIPDTSGLGRERDSRPTRTEATEAPTINIHLPESFMLSAPPPVVNVPAPIVNVPPAVVNVDLSPIASALRAPAPIVKVAPPDVKPFTNALDGLRADIVALRSDVNRPRTRTIVRDDMGRITGSIDD